MENKKLYQKTWFIWLLTILIWPIGLLLLWKYFDYSKRTKTIITSIVIGLAIIGSFTTKDQKNISTETSIPAENIQYSKEEQQLAFKSWNDNLKTVCKNVDDHWKLWEATFTGTSNGTISRFQAYDNMKNLSIYMDRFNTTFKEYPIPKELSKEHKKQLKKSLNSLASWTYYRHQACKDMKNILDNNKLKPSDLDSIKSTIKRSNSELMSGLAGVMSVENDLGLLEKSK